MIQVFTNIAVVIGLIPVTGVTLPLMSYGGSSLIITMFMMGIINNILKEANKNIDFDLFNWSKSSENVIYTGSTSVVEQYLSAMDAYILPSYREGFPNVVLQAGAMGLPSIVTDINGSNEIILPNENGVIIPSKDEEALYRAMENFLFHPEEVQRMAEKARSMIASRYDRKILWEALLKEYKRLIDN